MCYVKSWKSSNMISSNYVDLMVSVGRPYMSTSTYVPTFLSERNWPAMTCRAHSTVQYSTVQYSTAQYSTVQYSTVQYSTDLHGALRGDHAVHRGLGEGVELLVLSPHEVWLQQVAAVAVIFELALNKDVYLAALD